MPAYVPPHLRNRQQVPADDSPPAEASTPVASSGTHTERRSYQKYSNDDLFSIKEIHAHFFNDDEPIGDHGDNSTLHASTERPHILAWVLLFKGANPKWDSDQMIFVKSNLDLLPAIEGAKQDGNNQAERQAMCGVDEDNNAADQEKPDSTPVDSSSSKHPFDSSTLSNEHPKAGKPVVHLPFAVFAQPFRSEGGRCFKFVGWYKIAHLELLPSRSQALVGMLLKKWQTVDRFGRVHQRERNGAAWEASLRHAWAAITMVRDEEATKKKGEPNIERLDEAATGGAQTGKSVNEMLAEMRMTDGVKDASPG
ncbi:hypothetical protein BDV96DRAFT_562001 [Lophiotrema nucula]|uniref:Uncharacterized protein n=1 Tax=Lophiotrema nucula TaxID=690887 RepID=A0A6A5ZV09_9PLEO|nr:hypothetical protein BDV96DRAFT_562001 [Lophiotrema nucula]